MSDASKQVAHVKSETCRVRDVLATGRTVPNTLKASKIFIVQTITN